jgi:uncharacterized membrane protein YdjX (TVP38/TMEM64 family)
MMPAMVVPSRHGRYRRLLPVAALLAALALFFGFGLQRYFNLDALKDHRATLLEAVADHYAMALLGFIALYALLVAISFPGAGAMTIAGGFLFGLWVGTVASAIGATLGAALLFLIARHAVGDALRGRARPWLERVEKGFKSDGASYLLVLRLIPLFPFFAINLVAPFLGVSFLTYVATTLVGILPGSFVYTSFGDGLGAIFDAGGTPTLRGILTPEIVMGLVGLAVLALLPVLYRRFVRPRLSDRKAG